MATIPGDVVGDGPVATVYSGLHDGVPVALKVFPKSFGKRTLAAFERERSALPAHPCVLRVDGVETLSGGRHALRMELCAQSLATLVGRAGPLPAGDVALLGQAIASGLAAAHAADVVHGGVSPHNVLFRHTGEPLVADFGVTLRHAFPRDPLHVIEFLPPEALRTSVLDERTDLYGLGAVLYFALTGNSPHPGRLGEPESERVLRVLRTPVPAISRPDVPVALSTVVGRLLAIDPAHRPVDAAAVAAQLAAMVPAAPPVAVLPAPISMPPPEPIVMPSLPVPSPVPSPPEPIVMPPLSVSSPVSSPPEPIVMPPLPAPPVDEQPPPVPVPDVPPAPVAEPGEFDDFAQQATPADPAGHEEFDDFGGTPAPPVPRSQLAGGFHGFEPPPFAPPPAAVVFDTAGTRPRRRGVRYELIAGGVLLAGLAVLVGIYLMPVGGEPASGPPPPSSAQDIPTARAVGLELADPVDRDDEVELSWTSTATLEFGVVVAGEGEQTRTLVAHRNLTFTVPVEPGRKYCFLIRATDGNQLYESAPKAIRGAVCRK
ncbi:hypothetical protein GCM10017774_43180 [Lentzea cavernae]|uniref:non-specific serine/threonine protein kinase n=2 Tax=Lentzea cavernae TaxID=2020703 RepID=A0ABQ3MMM8_9PSEU|nr:hypothetical protein GCM10017774_43180 [Lentzea cavernae]